MWAPCARLLLALDERRVLCKPGLHNLCNLRHVKLHKGVTKCRDRHRQAQPIICVPFWAITRSHCVSICFCIPFPHSLPFNGTDFGQYINTRIVFRVPILIAQKEVKK